MIWFGTVPTLARVVGGVAILGIAGYFVKELVSELWDGSTHSDDDDDDCECERRERRAERLLDVSQPMLKRLGHILGLEVRLDTTDFSEFVEDEGMTLSLLSEVVVSRLARLAGIPAEELEDAQALLAAVDARGEQDVSHAADKVADEIEAALSRQHLLGRALESI